MDNTSLDEGEGWLNPHEHYYYQCRGDECFYQVDVFKFLDCIPPMPPSHSLDVGKVGVRVYPLPSPVSLHPKLLHAEIEVLIPPSGIPQAISVRTRSRGRLGEKELDELRWKAVEALCAGSGLLQKT